MIFIRYIKHSIVYDLAKSPFDLKTSSVFRASSNLPREKLF